MSRRLATSPPALDSTGNDEVGRLGSSFDTMLAALHESVTAQRQLVADASHELRTPLTSLTTNLDLLEDGAGLADPQAPALVRAAREQAGELDQLITDLLDLARYRESTPHRETVRLDLLTERGGAPPATAHAAFGHRHRPASRAWCTSIPPAVDHAICNLIDNAIKWTSSDGVVHVVVEDGRVSVTDHGPGIPTRISRTSSNASIGHRLHAGMPGAGLGLAIVARIAQANHATVDVRTGPDGSTFTLAFPPPPRAAELVQDEQG